MAEKKSNSQSQLAKTQKMPVFETRIIPPGTRDAEARKLIQDYAKIEATLKYVRKYNPLNPIIFLLIKKRLAGLVQQEFELYKSFPEQVKKEKRASSLELVSVSVQRELNQTSKSISNRLNDLIKIKLLQRRYMQEVYTFKLPPIRVPTKEKKFKSVFTSSNMKKKFS